MQVEPYSGRIAPVSLTAPALRMLIFFIWHSSFPREPRALPARKEWRQQ
jgi:hypothetical protein